MTQPRHVRQPGPVSPARLESCVGAARALAFALEPGLCLNDAVARPLEQASLSAAGVILQQARFHPFRYVIPAYAPDDRHAAFYSETFAPDGEVELEAATLTFGRRAEGPFLHCHALWREGDRRCGGHVLPLEAIVAAPGRALAFGTAEVEMRSEFDPETNFSLFRPLPLAAASDRERCLVARIRPNQDLVGSIEALCREHGILRAKIHSGIGSTIGMRFDDGRVIDERPTELLILDGRIEPDADGRARAHLPLGVIDVHGNVHHGMPEAGENPVLICFELILEKL